MSGEPGDHVVALKAFLVSRDIELLYANAELGAAHGASLKGRILLRDDLSPAVEFSVLVHEIAHELLRTGDRRADTSKTVRETEAEAVAFVVSHIQVDGWLSLTVREAEGDGECSAGGSVCRAIRPRNRGRGYPCGLSGSANAHCEMS